VDIRLKKEFSISLVLRVTGAASGFILSFYIAYLLSPHDAGVYFYVLSVMVLLSAVCRFGLDSYVLKKTSIYDMEDNYKGLNTILNLSTSLVVVVYLVVLLAYFITPDFLLLKIFKTNYSVSIQEIMLICLPAYSMMLVYGMYFQGLGQIKNAVFLAQILPSFLFVLLVSLVEASTRSVAVSYSISCIISAVFSFFVIKRYIRNKKLNSTKIDNSVSDLDLRMVVISVLPFTVIMVVSQLVQLSSQVLGGVWMSYEEIGLLAIAQKFSLVMTFVITAVNMVVAPKFAQLYKVNKIDDLKILAVKSTNYMVLIALPLLLVMIFLPVYLMDLFGENYQAAGGLLRILAIGQFVAVATGSVGYILGMTGNEKYLKNAVLLSALLTIILVCVLVPMYGAYGGALATAIGISSQNIICAIYVWKKLGFSTIGFLN
jgi:O-antigen/teichoic acid export membrane protein